MNILNVRIFCRQFVSSRRWIMQCSVLALLLTMGIAMPNGVSASTSTITSVRLEAHAVAKKTVTGVVPRPTAGSVKTSSQQSLGSVTKVDLNTASAEQLASALVGVGSAKAKAIVQYRTEVGPFRSIAELEEVKGIGPSIVALNKERISVDRAKR